MADTKLAKRSDAQKVKGKRKTEYVMGGRNALRETLKEWERMENSSKR